LIEERLTRTVDNSGRICGIVEKLIIRPFQSMSDYADPWRHPVSGAGHLYVIDECHLALPRGNTSIEVEEWFSLHRHESADVLLIAQSHGKVSKNICDMLQVVYKVRKNIALGFSSSYSRKVQDGLQGEIVNSSVRQYDKRYFGFYKSHTRGGGSELESADVRPIWLHWSFIGFYAFVALLVVLLAFTDATLNPFKVMQPKVVKTVPDPRLAGAEPYVPSFVVASSVASPAPVLSTVTPAKVAEVIRDDTHHPIERLELHIVAHVSGSGRDMYQFLASQNGQGVFTLSSYDLRKMGYHVQGLADCSAEIMYKESYSRFVTCDSPRLSVDPSSTFSSSGESGAHGGAPLSPPVGISENVGTSVGT
jgi:zona occludens toxin